MKSLKIGDYIIICLIIVSVVLGQYYMISQNTGGNLKTIVIRVDQKEFFYKLNVNESKEIIFDFDGHQGVLHFKDGKIKMETMDIDLCPKQICSKTGWIEFNYESIVCLPNKIIVTINFNKGDDLDSVSF